MQMTGRAQTPRCPGSLPAACFRRLSIAWRDARNVALYCAVDAAIAVAAATSPARHALSAITLPDTTWAANGRCCPSRRCMKGRGQNSGRCDVGRCGHGTYSIAYNHIYNTASTVCLYAFYEPSQILIHPTDPTFSSPGPPVHATGYPSYTTRRRLPLSYLAARLQPQFTASRFLAYPPKTFSMLHR